MAVVSVSPIPEGHTGAISKGVRTYRRPFLVTVDSHEDGPYAATGTAALALGLPAYASQHTEDSNAWMSELSATREGSSKYHWRVECSYTSEREAFSLEQADANANPEDDPVIIDWDSYELMVVMHKDAAGDPVLNSAGDPFDPMPERPVTILVAQFRANVTEVIPDYFFDLGNMANDADIEFDGRTISAGYALCKRPKATSKLIRGTTIYREISYEIHVRKDRKWTELDILNQGFNAFVGGVKKKVLVQDTDGEYVEPTEPVLLNAAGEQLSSGGTPTYETYVEYESADLTLLPGITSA